MFDAKKKKKTIEARVGKTIEKICASVCHKEDFLDTVYIGLLCFSITSGCVLAARTMFTFICTC